MFFLEKKPPAGLHHTEERIGDAPKPQFLIKSIGNQKIRPSQWKLRFLSCSAGCFPHGLLAKISTEAQAKIKDFVPQDIVMCAWA